MSATIFVPRDAGALALGADEVAEADRSARSPRAASTPRSCATARAALYWLEPMVEVETAAGRVAYGPVAAERRRRRCSTPASSTGGAHPLSLGDPEEIPFFARQTRLTFARCGITDPLSLDDYAAHGGLEGPAEGRRDGAGRRSSRR